MKQTQEPKLVIVKLLAITGFLAMLALIVWFAVQGLRAFPNAFSSLASIAESIQGYKPNKELKIALEKNIVNSGETFKVTWTDMRGDGSYHFGYTCADGVLLSVKSDDGIMREISCTEDLELPKEATGLFIAANSKEQRFSNLTFSVRFDSQKGDKQITESHVTVVNAVVPTIALPATTTPVTITVEAPEQPVIPKPEPAPTTPAPVPTKPVATKPSVPVKPASSVPLIPVSDPNGYIDLKATFSGIGAVNGTSFTPIATYTSGERAGLRFEVKNIGTKRSGTWTYRLELPGGVYESDAQEPLEPSERATFTVGFDVLESKATSVTLKGSVSETKDVDSKNNTFSWFVKLVK